MSLHFYYRFDKFLVFLVLTSITCWLVSNMKWHFLAHLIGCVQLEVVLKSLNLK